MKYKNLLFYTMLLIMVPDILFSRVLHNRTKRPGFTNGFLSASSTYSPSIAYKINKSVEKFGLEKFEENYFSYGFELHGNFNPAMGIGIKYVTGGDSKQKIVFVEDGQEGTVKLDRAIDVSVSHFGLSLSYRKFLINKFEFFGALGASYGSVEIVISQDHGDQTFDDVWDAFEPDSGLNSRYNRSVFYSSGLSVFESETGLRIYAGSRIATGVSVAYTYGFVSKKGDINNGFESIKNVPDLNFSGLTYKATIYFGY